MLANAISLLSFLSISAGLDGRFRACDNSQHRAPTPPSVGQDEHTVRECSSCHSVVYCSQRCQKEDWESLHQAECRGMRNEHHVLRYTKGLRYSQTYRAFHLSVLRRAFDGESPVLKLAKVVIPDPWSRKGVYLGRKVVLSIDVADIDDPLSVDPLPDFIKMTLPHIPKHLAKRFKDLVGLFTAFETSETDKAPVLVNGTFFYGDLEVNHLVLLRKSQAMATTHQRQDLPPKVEICGSLVYTW
ncbi:hypothetical protein FA13DRAFT_1477852 [Coprinellus micaceus]|uniref:MYND-type domain-containing protein n=1 Tax=Coprinellus micaceus TaxID=71717 RepID=A0A4Y7SLT9_COPMI|nr:hypothetical protein FA13DRAFT_1477852 [Coprinellus micaceus]